MDHLVYCDAKADVLKKIFGKSKTMIIRGAAGRKLPHGRVFKGDKLYFIENDGSGLIKGKAIVTDVENTEKMDEETSKAVVDKHAQELNLSKKQYDRWAGKKVLCLVSFEQVEPIEPMKYDRQGNMDDWIAVEDIKDILVGTNVKYESIKVK